MLRLGTVFVFVVILALVAPTGGSEACPIGKQTTVAKLTTSKAKARVAHVVAKMKNSVSERFTARLSTAAVGAKAANCCGQGSSHGHGHSCAHASCSTCLPGIAVDFWSPLPPVIASDNVVSTHRSVAEFDLIPDLPPPRFS